MSCEKCGEDHDGGFGSGRFCSRSCANSRPRSDKTRAKIGDALREKPSPHKGKHFVARDERICPTCAASFAVISTNPKKYCSLKCNPKVGGYREGSGRAKTGYYCGIYCGSSYELVWVIHRLDHGLPAKRFEGFLTDGVTTYYPDFLDDDTIIEIKGYEDKKSVDRKTKLAQDKGYRVELLYREDLAEQFKWVSDNYQYSDIWELYDDHKPRHVYKCSECGVDFGRERVVKTELKFCSRKCNGVHRAKIMHGKC